MRIYLARHGQTELNRKELMQGRTDEPLNETGRLQAKTMREKMGDIRFDAVYASPLDRAQETAMIIGAVSREELLIDERIIETDFGPYEQCPYTKMGLLMSAYWALPEVFPAPKGVETVAQMKKRAQSFLKEIEAKEYDNVLIVCHGGILRSLWGYLEDKKNGLRWRPKPKNCELRIYESKDGIHTFLNSMHYESSMGSR